MDAQELIVVDRRREPIVGLAALVENLEIFDLTEVDRVGSHARFRRRGGFAGLLGSGGHGSDVRVDGLAGHRTTSALGEERAARPWRLMRSPESYGVTGRDASWTCARFFGPHTPGEQPHLAARSSACRWRRDRRGWHSAASPLVRSLERCQALLGRRLWRAPPVGPTEEQGHHEEQRGGAPRNDLEWK